MLALQLRIPPVKIDHPGVCGTALLTEPYPYYQHRFLCRIAGLAGLPWSFSILSIFQSTLGPGK
jgi:hypothetical protein